MEFASMAYTNIGTNTAVLTTAGVFYGMSIIPKSTGVVLVAVFDATATATGTQVFGLRAASTAGTTAMVLDKPIAMRTGIYISALTITAAEDRIVVFYGPAR